MILEKFYFGGKILEGGPSFGMTDLSMGSMRFRWNESNENRNSFLKHLCADGKTPAAVELVHSKIVHDIESSEELDLKTGDGILTRNKAIVPVVTVADCVPLFIYDMKSGTFGVVHSGWKGTGIIGEAIKIIMEKHSSHPDYICVAIGPHIGECCYNVNEERAAYFARNFSAGCVKKNCDDGFSLSLTDANLAVLEKLSVPRENIRVIDKCTCCHKENGRHEFGSFRRQSEIYRGKMPLENLLKMFTVQAAFVKW